MLSDGCCGDEREWKSAVAVVEEEKEGSGLKVEWWR